MSHKLQIKEGAFIISDAHYSNLRPEFLSFIKDIYAKKLKPSIFDALFGNIPYTKIENDEILREIMIFI